MMTMRLKYVEQGVHFGHLRGAKRLVREQPRLRGLKGNEVACLVSVTQRHIMFVVAPREFDQHSYRVVASMRMEIDALHKNPAMPGSPTWHPLALADYARAAGIKLEGLKTYKEHFDAVVRRVAKAALGKASASRVVRRRK